MDSFKEWLVNDKGLKNKSARDVLSRVMRVSKILDIPVEKIVGSTEHNNLLINRLKQEKETYLKDCNYKYNYLPLARALKLYVEYNNSN